MGIGRAYFVSGFALLGFNDLVSVVSECIFGRWLSLEWNLGGALNVTFALHLRIFLSFLSLLSFLDCVK